MHSIQLYLPRFMNKYQRTNIYIKLYIVNLKKRTLFSILMKNLQHTRAQATAEKRRERFATVK